MALIERIDAAETEIRGLLEQEATLRREFEADGVIDRDEQAELDRVREKITQLEGVLGQAREDWTANKAAWDARADEFSTLEAAIGGTSPGDGVDMARLETAYNALREAVEEQRFADATRSLDEMQEIYAAGFEEAASRARSAEGTGGSEIELPRVSPEDPRVRALIELLPFGDTALDTVQFAEAASHFAQGVSEGYAAAMPEGGHDAPEIDSFADFYGGYLMGIAEGIGTGIKGLVDVIGWIAGTAVANSPAGIAWGMITEGPVAYGERRIAEAQKVIAIGQAIYEFSNEYESNPGSVGGDIGRVVGQIMATEIDEFIDDTDYEKGRKIGVVAGAIVLEIITEVLLALATEGLGNLARVAAGIGQAARATAGGARYAARLRAVIESAPSIQRLLRKLNAIENGGDAVRVIETAGDGVEAGGDAARVVETAGDGVDAGGDAARAADGAGDGVDAGGDVARAGDGDAPVANGDGGSGGGGRSDDGGNGGPGGGGAGRTPEEIMAEFNKRPDVQHVLEDLDESGTLLNEIGVDLDDLQRQLGSGTPEEMDAAARYLERQLDIHQTGPNPMRDGVPVENLDNIRDRPPGRYNTEAKVRGDLGEHRHMEEIVGEGVEVRTASEQLHNRTVGELVDELVADRDIRKFMDNFPDGSVRQITLPTGDGPRVIDHMYRSGDSVVLRESKNYQDFKITNDMRRQLNKDLDLADYYDGVAVEWRIDSGVTLSDEVIAELDAVQASSNGTFRYILGQRPN